MKTVGRLAPPAPRPAGAVAVSFAVSLPVILGLMGIVIDLSLMYLRNTQLQQLADATAATAAAELNGTKAGVTAAITRSNELAVQMSYGGPYRAASNFDANSWSTTALFLGPTQTGPWTPIDSVATNIDAAPLVYARVDTAKLAELAGNPGAVSTNVLSRLLDVNTSVALAPTAVAGRVAMHVTPFGVCALSNTKFQPRQAAVLPPATAAIPPELVEFGFRRGITYDLRDLNPGGPTGRAFVINPVDPAGQDFPVNTVKAFFCSGTIAYGTLRPGSSVRVKPASEFSFAPWLNARFDDFSTTDACPSRPGAPPDYNVRDFVPTYSWMATTPVTTPVTTTGLNAAKPTLIPIAGSTEQARVTIADVNFKVEGQAANNTEEVTATKFGPLWVYSKPAIYVAGSATGMATTPQYFTTTQWPALYQVASSGPSLSGASYLAPSPYKRLTTLSGYTFGERRVLNLPLLDCMGAISDTATVLGFGRFFMTSRATDTAVYGEFAGLADVRSLSAGVRRVQ